MLGRLARDIGILIRQSTRIIRDRRWALGYAVYLLGELVGASRWLLTQRGREAA
jgi:hypothetical protein